MDFEYDPEMSLASKDKHGIDFVAAQALWDDPSRVEIPARVSDEARSLVIGMIADKHWSAIVTYRSEHIRLLSVRRARKEEIAIYESL